MTGQPKDYFESKRDVAERAKRETERANRWRLIAIFAATCAFAIGGAWAARADPTAHLSKLCLVYGQAAERIMAARQLGQPMTVYMQIADGDSFMERFVLAAYDRPRWQTQTAIVDEVREFSAQIEAECWRRLAR